MFPGSSLLLLVLSATGLLLLALQALLVRRARRAPAVTSGPGISVLKPLCGTDDELAANLACFASLDHPDYEVMLGVRDPADPAYPVARAAERRWPGRMRVVLQQGSPGLNPKVNQLITLEQAARHPLVVISDSNVRVEPGYLREIALELSDPRVGMVTHPVVGVGARRLGSRLDGLHLRCGIAPGMVAARRAGGGALVVGKSMALWRRDLHAMGGFEAVKDVLAEDYLMGRMVERDLGLQVSVARSAIHNVSVRHGAGHFFKRYLRWSVMQRQAVGPVVYGMMGLLNPVFLAIVAVVLDPGVRSLSALAACCLLRMAIDASTARALTAAGHRHRDLLLVPLRDLLLGIAWVGGAIHDEVDWRGNRLRVLPGTRLQPLAVPTPEPASQPVVGA